MRPSNTYLQSACSMLGTVTGPGDMGANKAHQVVDVLQKYNKYLEILEYASHYLHLSFILGIVIPKIHDDRLSFEHLKY